MHILVTGASGLLGLNLSLSILDTHQVTGVDPDWQSLSRHRLAGQRPPFARAVAVGQELPFANESFDLIVSSWVLEHLARPEKETQFAL